MQEDEQDFSFTEYQVLTSETAIYPGQGTMLGLAYAVLGASNESGEIAGKLKKALRDDEGVVTDERRESLLAEVGDTLWYLARVCDELDSSLEEVASANIAKLLDRSARGVLAGDGDKR